MKVKKNKETKKYKCRMIEELEKIKARIDEEVVYVNKWQVKNDSIKS